MIRFYSAYRYYFYKYLGQLKRLFGMLKTKDLCIQFRDQIGEYTYGFPEIFPFKDRTVKIGKFCSIANDVKIFLGHEHYMKRVSMYPFNDFGDFTIDKDTFGYSKGDVIIGNDVWIGYGAIILSGVTIGDGAVIGARSVVTKNVEPYTVVVGSPARPVKKRFEDETISRLLKIKWWNWSKEKIQRNLSLLCSEDISAFIKQSE